MNYLRDLQLDKDLEMNIFDYDSASEVLAEYVKRSQAINRRYSYRHFSKRLNSTSPGYIQELIKGKRSFTDEVLDKIVRMMGIVGRAEEYFDLLAHRDRLSEESPLHEEYTQRLKSIRRGMQNAKTFDEAQIDCHFSWLHLIIREMALLQNSRIDLAWIQKSFSTYGIPYSKKNILQCIDDMKRINMLVEKDGEYLLQEPLLQFADEKISTMLYQLLTRLHKEVMEHALFGLSYSPKQREYGSVIVATSPEKFREVKKKLKQIRLDLGEALEVPPGEANLLVSFSFQLFPVARSPEEK